MEMMRNDGKHITFFSDVFPVTFFPSIMCYFFHYFLSVYHVLTPILSLKR